jgi:hypothetical protein
MSRTPYAWIWQFNEGLDGCAILLDASLSSIYQGKAVLQKIRGSPIVLPD